MADQELRTPSDQPFRYVAGGWPNGYVRRITDAEGGEFVQYQLEQLRALVAELVERRKQRGVSQAGLARITGLRPNTISDLEAGKSYPDWHTLARIAYGLDADIRLAARQAVRVEQVPPRA
jgi:DNA-binding XRE family transcriptional regulator